MNSLNILSAHVIGTTPKPKRSRSLGDTQREKESPEDQPKRSFSQHVLSSNILITQPESPSETKREDNEKAVESEGEEKIDEKTPLLQKDNSDTLETKYKQKGTKTLVRRLAIALTESIKWVISKIISSGVYVISCFYDDGGRFSPIMPARRLRRRPGAKSGIGSTAHAVGLSGSPEASDSDTYVSEKSFRTSSSRRQASITPTTSDSEVEARSQKTKRSSKAKMEGSSSSDNLPTRRSIRIKLNKEEQARHKKSKKQKTASDVAKTGNASNEEAAAAELKSPTSPASPLRITKYPQSPYPPRPLIPRRRSSYSENTKYPNTLAQKTLVIDLDETLIHSLAKGGRMSTGHMVEVKLSSPAAYNGLSLGPQHPILYYVHKRPHCDDFLKRVSKWYNLVVFTASVQEYADPVIDWLEQEKQFFSARYYRQHCTFRNGAYIKDLSSVEPDLSKVMILDNSPLSYIFHEGKTACRRAFNPESWH